MYANVNVDLVTNSLAEMDLQKLVRSNKEAFAEFGGVSMENVKVISRREYEENSEDD